MQIKFVVSIACGIVCLAVLPAQINGQQITSKHTIVPVSKIEKLPTRIAFGSCAKETKAQPILETVVAAKPDLFIYLGDNIYGDTKDIKVLAKKYSTLGNKPEFQKLAKQVPLLSVWDDHDYGWNDAGKEYPLKAESKSLFMDFWQVPKNSDRRQHEGIYGAHSFTENGKTLQVILLDTRTFRDPLRRNPKPIPAGKSWKNSYQPDADPQKTLLGQQQWKWLEQEFKKPADLRIVCSSIQFGHQYNGWESWTNLPAQQQAMVQLITKTNANGVVFISGDVHWGEISRRNFPGVYPIFDVTASGLTEQWYNVEPNLYRVGQAVRENHFGVLQIDWKDKHPKIIMQILDQAGTVRQANSYPLDGLKFEPAEK